VSTASSPDGEAIADAGTLELEERHDEDEEAGNDGGLATKGL
jgi:hypothetical protein